MYETPLHRLLRQARKLSTQKEVAFKNTTTQDIELFFVVAVSKRRITLKDRLAYHTVVCDKDGKIETQTPDTGTKRKLVSLYTLLEAASEFQLSVKK